MFKLTPVLALAVLLGACNRSEAPAVEEAAPAGASTFATDDDRVLYAVGVAIGDQIAEFNFTEAEIEFVASGFRDSATKVPPKVEMEVYGPQIQRFVDERMRAGREAELAQQAEALNAEKAAAAAFAARIAAQPGAESNVSGLIYVPITVGEGESPDALDTVTVHYHGTFHDGTVFDSSVDRGMPATFPLSGVIPCWTEGVQKIRVGGKAQLLCPSDIAYGDEGCPGIPGGAALLFEVELIAIEAEQ
jgi:FKBP-type peptidyl-prolyl cis-trans isomerase FkpA